MPSGAAHAGPVGSWVWSPAPRPWADHDPDTDRQHPDRDKRNFTAEDTGAKLVGDITYIKTWNGWLYLATVIDCYTKMVVGYAMATHMETSLIRAAIDMAVRNITLPKDAIFHSDRGSQYTSGEYRKHLRELGIRPSLGRTATCSDTAIANNPHPHRPRLPHRIPDLRTRPPRYCAIHRILLQSETSPLRTRVSDPH